MQMFHKNKDTRSKDQNTVEFQFILLAMTTSANRIFLVQSRISFRVNFISGLI